MNSGSHSEKCLQNGLRNTFCVDETFTILCSPKSYDCNSYSTEQIFEKIFFFFKSRNPFPGPTQVWMVWRTLQHISLLYLICLLIRNRSNGSRATETQTDRHTNKQAICKIVELRLRPYFIGSTRNSDRQQIDSNWEMTLWRHTFDWYLLSVRLRALMSETDLWAIYWAS